ncbi:TPA: tyrosine-type recombinase/integrase [Citrobacter freundii]|nr:tyrosine-type recombinase/integrase [Citrobacter freundii]
MSSITSKRPSLHASRSAGYNDMIKNDRDVVRLRIPEGKKSVTQPVKTTAPAGGLFLLKRITPAGSEVLTWFFRHGGKRYAVGNSKTAYATACELYGLKVAQVLRNEVKPADVRPRWTMDTLFNKWIDAEGTPGAAIDLSRLWRKHWSPVCGKLVAVEMNYRRIVEIVNDVRAGMIDRDGKVQANALSRGARFIPRMFTYGFKHGIANEQDEPISVPQTLKASIDKNQLPPKTEPRQATLTAQQYRELFHQLPDNAAGNALRVVMLTGRRKREALEMVRQELRGDVWVISGKRAKNGKPQEVPIFTSLRTVLERSTNEIGRLWDAGTTTPNLILNRLNMMASYEDENGERIETPCTVHDLRRSWAELLRTECKLDRETVDLMLAHTPQNADSTSTTYQKLRLDMQSAAVMNGWRKWDEWCNGEMCKAEGF